MRAGNLRHLVSLQSNSPTEDGYGGDVDNYTEYDKAYAEILPLQGREFYAAQQVNSEITFAISIRYRSDVFSSHRIVYSGVTYEVAAPPQDVGFRHEELKLLCKVIA